MKQKAKRIECFLGETLWLENTLGNEYLLRIWAFSLVFLSGSWSYQIGVDIVGSDFWSTVNFEGEIVSADTLTLK